MVEETEQHYRRNLALATPVDLFWGLGASLVAVGPIITVLLQRLGATNLLIALAPALQTVGFGLLQLPAVHLTRHLRAKKLVFMSLHWTAGAWVLGGMLVLAWGQTRPAALIVAIPIIGGLYAMGLSLVTPLWGQMLPRLFPDSRRGFVGGMLSLAGGLGGIAGGAVAAWVLTAYPFPRNFAYLLLAGGGLQCGSILLYLFVHETVPQASPEEPEPRLLTVAARLWRSDRRLRRFVLMRYVAETGMAATAFLAVWGLERYALPDRFAGNLALAASLGTAATALFIGRIGDRRGYRRVLAWALAGYAAALLLALVGGRAEVMYVVFFLLGVAGPADWIGGVNLMVEMGDETTRGYYLALSPTLTLPLRLLAPFAWGWLGDRVGLPWVFGAGLAFLVMGWLGLLALVEDPRRPGQRIMRRVEGPPWLSWR
jgi:MFS family permease